MSSYINYRDLPPGRLRALAYSREIELANLRELHLVSSSVRNTTLVRRNALRRSVDFYVSRPNVVNGTPSRAISSSLHSQQEDTFLTRVYSDIPLLITDNTSEVDTSEVNTSEVDYSDMPLLEEIDNPQIDTVFSRIVTNELYPDTYFSRTLVNLNLISDKLIEKSSISMNYFNDNFCVICQDDIQIVPKPKCIMRVLECTHAFHIDCVDKWFTNNKTCPTCKYEFD